MAWSGLTFGKNGRQRLAIVLRALLITQLILSLVMAIFCYNVSVKAMSLLKHIHKLTVYLLYGLILLQAYCMKLHYTSGLRLLSWLLKYPHWHRATTVTRLWMLSGLLMAANGIFVYVACRSTLKALIKELSTTLRVGISQYLTEPYWKIILDTMQVELECCGAEQPGDWAEIPWLNIEYLNQDSDLVMKLAGVDGKVLPPVTPYSCCTAQVLAACYHDPLQQWEWRNGANGANGPVWSGGAGLQSRGCVEATRAPLARATRALLLCSWLAVILQVIIMCVSQLVRSSARSAALRGDAAGAGRAHLLFVTSDDTGRESEIRIGRTSLVRRRHVRRLRSRLSYPYLS